jgi:DNA-binding transcriptional MerR regulator
MGKNWKPLNMILRSGDQLAINMGYYLTSEVGKRVSEKLNDKTATIRETELSYRVVNNWESVGLIDNKRPSGKGWRKFSLMDAVWMKIIGELRKFGVSLDKIKQTKESLYRATKPDREGFPWLEHFVVSALVYKHPVMILVFDTGWAEPVFLDEYIANLETFGLQPHVHINLNSILQAMYPDKDLSPVDGNTVQLSDEEMELLLLIRTGEYEQLTVKQQDGRIELIEGTQTEKPDQRITEILGKGEWQDISLKQRDGKVVSIKRTVQKKAKRGGKKK